MKKYIALIAAVVSFGAFADSYLYWLVGDSITRDGSEFTGYDTAKVGVMDASGKCAGYLTIYGENATQNYGEKIGMTPGDNSPFYANLGTWGSGYSFYIELFNDTTSVGRSEKILKYADALSYATSFGTSNPAKLWNVASFTTAAVPEPSSALLLLLGCAGLALKRKKQAKA